MFYNKGEYGLNSCGGTEKEEILPGRILEWLEGWIGFCLAAVEEKNKDT